MRDSHIRSPATTTGFIFSCQVCWRTMRWHNGRTRHSENPYPEEVFQECQTNGEKNAAHSILARSYCFNEGRIHLRRPTCHSHFSLATRWRTIHSGWPTTRELTRNSVNTRRLTGLVQSAPGKASSNERVGCTHYLRSQLRVLTVQDVRRSLVEVTRNPSHNMFCPLLQRDAV
jgi:hypothetical protein